MYQFPTFALNFFGAVLLIKGIFADRCSLSYFSKCDCDRQGTTMNCTNVGFPDTDVLLHITSETFPKLDTLIMTGNHFVQLEPNLFGEGQQLPLLTRLVLSNNEVQQISGKAFSGVQNLEELILSNNEIVFAANKDMKMLAKLPNLRVLELVNAFNATENITEQIYYLDDLFKISSLTKLRELRLDQNNLSYLPKDLFCYFPQLEQLSLQQNQLSNFGSRPDCLQGLAEIYLQGNRFSYTDSRFMNFVDDLKNLRIITLNDNRWNCDCNLKPFMEWLRDSERVKNKEKTLCYDSLPKDYSGTPLATVPLDKLQCPVDDSGYIHGVYIVIGLVIVGLCLFLCCLAYWNRGWVLRNTRQWKLTALYGYTVLGREPEVRAEFV